MLNARSDANRGSASAAVPELTGMHHRTPATATVQSPTPHSYDASTLVCGERTTKPAEKTKQKPAHSLAVSLAKSHPRLAAKTGYVAIDCCESVRIIPEICRPCCRQAHTALVLAKVLRSPLELPTKTQKMLNALSTINPQQGFAGLNHVCQQIFGVTNTVKDIYKLLTKSSLITAQPHIKQAVQGISAMGMLLTFGGKLLGQLTAAPSQKKIPLTRQLALSNIEAVAYVAIASLLIDQIVRGHARHEPIIPWLTACTVACALTKASDALALHASSDTNDRLDCTHRV